MRDFKRIAKIMEKFEELWALSPDLRCGQLILNLTREKMNSIKKIEGFSPLTLSDNYKAIWLDILWNLEDEDLLITLEKAITKTKHVLGQYRVILKNISMQEHVQALKTNFTTEYTVSIETSETSNLNLILEGSTSPLTLRQVAVIHKRLKTFPFLTPAMIEYQQFCKTPLGVKWEIKTLQSGV
jgi:hypothetical protein